MTLPEDAQTHDPPRKPAYRVPVGMPLRNDGRREGAVISVLIHAVIITLLLVPIVFSRTIIEKIEQGAGGAGPAGGGGGGRLGNDGGYKETLRYVKVVPTPVATPKTLPPVVNPPVVPEVKPPVVLPPVPQIKEQAAMPAPVQTISSISGFGSGRDGTAGAGPGSGGGVGSGIGTGRGSGVGPGTGGGNQVNYPPQPIEFFLPPLPPPSNVRGFKFIAEFDVDSTGRVLDFKFTDTPSGDYNRRIASVLKSMRFRPGTGPTGVPVRMKAQVGYEF